MTKDYFTPEELLAEIRKNDPDYVPPVVPEIDENGNSGNNEDNQANQANQDNRNENSNVFKLHLTPKIDVNDIKILTFNDMLKEKPDPIEFVMNPIIPKQGIVFIYAATGVGKTFFALNIAYAIAGGGDFLKYSCPKPRRVLYVDGEMAYSQIHARLMMIQADQGELDFNDNFLLLTPDKCPIRIPQLDESYGQDFYLNVLKQYDIDVIVFDNLSTLTNFDENKAHEWKPIQDYQIHLRSKGKTIINVHHAGKDKNGYRGTSRMLDVADLAISLQPQVEDQMDDNPQSKKFKIVYQKPRLLTGKDALSFEVIFENGRWTHQSIEVSIMDKVIECLNAKMSQREIARELFISQTTVHRLIKKARLTGLVKE